jgi:peptide-methionine (S)-S-oxide reductase
VLATRSLTRITLGVQISEIQRAEICIRQETGSIQNQGQKFMTKENAENEKMEVATLAGGCFWCVEAVFSIIRGVEKIEPGYTGGSVPNPSYEQVSSGTTGHAEAAQITFDPSVISFREILEIFFASHDPTTLNRQGPDVGTQYRSAIFYHNEEQKTTAEEVIAELEKEGIWDSPIVTQVEPLKVFYKAETYHKDYYKKHPNQPYCQAVIAPKLAKLQHRFLSKLKV